MNRNINILIILCLVLITIPVTMAETGKAGMGGAFLKVGIGARAIGMGRAYTSIAEGIDAVYYNPAGLAFGLQKEVGFTYHSLALDRNLNSAALTFPVRNEAIMAVSWINASVGDVPIRDSSGKLYDNMRNSNNAITLTFAKEFKPGLSAGANLRYIDVRLDEVDSYAIGADIGGLYKINSQYAVALNLANLGSKLRWDTGTYWSDNEGTVYDERFPIKVTAGASGRFLEEALTGSVDIIKYENLDFKFNLGAEYWFFKQKTVFVEDLESDDELIEKVLNKKFFGLRAGYGDDAPAFGASLYFPFGNYETGFDYAFLAGKVSEGSSHIFTVRIMF